MASQSQPIKSSHSPCRRSIPQALVRDIHTLAHTPSANRFSKQPVRKPYAHATVAYAPLRAHSLMPALVWPALRWFSSPLWCRLSFYYTYGLLLSLAVDLAKAFWTDRQDQQAAARGSRLRKTGGAALSKAAWCRVLPWGFPSAQGHGALQRCLTGSQPGQTF